MAATALVLAGSTAGCSTGYFTLEENPPAAACVAPHVSVEPAVARPGDEVTVRGVAMVDGCADAISVDEHGNQTPNETQSPIGSIDVILRTGEFDIVLATVDADANGEFEVTVVVPEGTPSGTMQVSTDVEHTEPDELEIVPES
ncbi:hypothetical protein [Georgenia soli]|uniref:hypothetical protein n=1 Tax=Georgenia soli TaxID=638953 RepID=UPI00117B6419|nr:hypothetical protein [Georgenia soli]